MRLPVVPFIVAVTLLAAAWYFFTATRPNRKILDVPRLTRLADIEGIETEVAVAPDGVQYAVIVSGDLWLLNIASGSRRQITRTDEEEVVFPPGLRTESRLHLRAEPLHFPPIRPVERKNSSGTMRHHSHGR